MSVAMLREGGKHYRQCKFFKSSRDFSEMSIFGCHKKLTLLNLLGKMNYRLHQGVLQEG